jgi:hypothetical protein
MNLETPLSALAPTLHFRDEYLDQTALSRYDLRLELDAHILRCAIVEASENQCRFLEEYRWASNTPADGVLPLIRNVIDQHELLPRNFWKSVQFVVNNPSFTLIPAPLFRKEYAVRYLELARGVSLAGEAVLHERHASWETENVFSLPTPLYDYLAGLYPFDDFRLVHHADLLLDVARQFDDKTFLIAVEPTSVTMLYAYKWKLFYCNRFEYRDVKDLIYYVLYVMSELKLNAAQLPVVAFGAIDVDSDAHIALHKYLGELTVGLPEALKAPRLFVNAPPAHRYVNLFHAVEAD